MKNHSCDVCRAPIKEGMGATLYDKYSEEGLRDVCQDCTRDLQDAHRDVTKIAMSLRDTWFKRFLKAYRAKRSGADVVVHKF